jgi:hypothetical protein
MDPAVFTSVEPLLDKISEIAIDSQESNVSWDQVLLHSTV